MPIYEYRCPTCGARFEKLVRFGSDEPVHCPTCDNDSAQRLMSTFSSISSSSGSAAYSSSSSSCGTST